MHVSAIEFIHFDHIELIFFFFFFWILRLKSDKIESRQQNHVEMVNSIYKNDPLVK